MRIKRVVELPRNTLVRRVRYPEKHHIARWIEMVKLLHPVAKNMKDNVISAMISQGLRYPHGGMFAVVDKKTGQHLAGLMVFDYLSVDSPFGAYEISMLWVDPELQRHGLATLLVTRVLHYLEIEDPSRPILAIIDDPAPEGAEAFWDHLLETIDDTQP